MAHAVDPQSGLQLYELSHVWGHGVPSVPGDDDVKMYRSVKHGQHGVMTHRITMVMHSGTHMNAPIHMIQGGAPTADIPLDSLFGNGVILSVPKERWEMVTADDLKSATPEIQKGDFVVIVTGWHHKYSDSLEYWGDSPGLSKEAAEYLVSLDVKMVGVDTPQVDHPLATSLGPQRGGPLMNRVIAKYEEATGGNAKADFPEWNPAHKAILGANIPTIEQVGGDVDDLLGKRATMMATPWRSEHGDACPVRFVAMTDPSGNCRIDAGGEE
ncbi:MAG: cyclase family protein [Rhodospirillaceae bacterium]|jgi:kynurenine formamidase|nr:cyclase family protein [Rhodospirillaceae bacterium]MBT4588114.1 cyclase family protein [Rhodospirillaceae bacterium]MBT4938831.1 cyclase family protein [Rhodospirillaceae bacterium]MBT7268471.1 cyclase family protein [Rhodospirillaceae bacterium]